MGKSMCLSAAPWCLFLLLLAQGTNASFRLLQDDAAAPSPSEAAAPTDFEAAEFAGAGAPEPEPLGALTPDSEEAASPFPVDGVITPQLFSPPEEPTEEEAFAQFPYEEAAFPTSSEEAAASPDLSPEDAAFVEDAAFTDQSPSPAPSYDPRDEPCVPSDRSSDASDFFTCSNFDGYYCTYDQFGASGSTCEAGGAYRCEPLSSSPSVYGIVASYPTPTAIFKYCRTSGECDEGQFCDKSPQKDYTGDIPIGNCVAYLDQGCLA